MPKNKFYGREDEIKTIEQFFEEEKSDILFVKGRRRVGKSYLLDEIYNKKKIKKNSVYHLGMLKDIQEDLYSLIVKIEIHFDLPEITKSVAFSKDKKINSDDFFSRLLRIVEKRKTKTILILDEVQWIGKDGGKEFAIKLKEFWVKLEKTGKFKIILTGSSYKFFQEYVSKATAILRSISSYSPMEILPFTPSEMKKFFFTKEKYKHYHVMLLYMMTGGVSQYIRWLRDVDSGFEFCVNASFFKKNSAFLTEVEELLKIDITEGRQASAVAVLEQMENKTLSFKEISERVSEKHSISDSTIRRIMEELIGMEFVSCKTENGEMIENPLLIEEVNKKYYISDLYLSFYFSLIHPLRNKIEFNEKENIFETLLDSKKEDFDEKNTNKIPVISSFTGNAFEMTVINVLKRKQIDKLPIFEKMKIEDTNFEVDTYNKSSKDQIDVFIKYKTYSKIKVIECKWISNLDKKKTAKTYSEEVSSKNFHNELSSHDRENYYMFTVPIQKRMAETMNNNNVLTLNYRDLFEK